MSAHRETPRHRRVQSTGTIRGRFRRLITHEQSRRAGLLWDSASNPPDSLHLPESDNLDRNNNNNNKNKKDSSYYYYYYYYLPVSVIGPHGDLSSKAVAAPEAAVAAPKPPPQRDPEGIPSFFWTAEEDRQLLELREQSKLDWEEIAGRLMGRRSASACCSRYNRTLFNKHIEKMASKSNNNNNNNNEEGPSAMAEQEREKDKEEEEGIHRHVSTPRPETSPPPIRPQAPVVIPPLSTSLPGCHEHVHGHNVLSRLELDEEGDQSFVQLRSAPPEPLEPRVADTCLDALTKARFCLSLGL